MALMTRLGANLFFRTIAGGAASALAAVALTRLGVGQNQDLIIIGALMALRIPGAMIIGILAITLAGMLLGVSPVPAGRFFPANCPDCHAQFKL